MQLPPQLDKHPSQDRQGTDVRMERRRFLRQLCSTALVSASGLAVTACRSTDNASNNKESVRFLHGVASGDPLADRVILWTRVTPGADQAPPQIPVRWEVAADSEMQRIIVGGETLASMKHDYTVKVDARGLKPGQTYYYRFVAGKVVSPVGRTKTLPDNAVRQVKLAVFSCASYPSGYFNVYADAAKQPDLDAALHIGDYIYEYESTGYGTEYAKELDRLPDPDNALMVLADYRRRYAQYRSDTDLQALHASLPFITVWDDHEFADDTWRNGAADHRPTVDGPFSYRRSAAIQAYHEWMPIRAPNRDNPDQIYRSFDFGRLVSLHMLDTRVVGRDRQIAMSDYFDDQHRLQHERFLAEVTSPQRQLLGQQQIAWLEQRIARSNATWQILGQQVLMARMEYPLAVLQEQLSCAEYVALKRKAQTDPASLSNEERSLLTSPPTPCYMDSWDGYQGDREKIFSMMRRHNRNLVVLTGDTHNAWASDLHDREGRPIGVEFATASVTSPGLERAYPKSQPPEIARMMQDLIGTLRYAQTSKRGYMLITANAQEVRADWRFVDTVFDRKFAARTEHSLRTRSGETHRRIVEVD